MLQDQMRSKEEILAEFQKYLLQKDRELEKMKAKSGKSVPKPEQSSV